MEHDLANQVSRRVTRSADGRVNEERGFSYDRAGRLQRERNGSGDEVASYRYGYLDKVMSVSRGGVDTRFHYDPSGLLVGKQREGEDEMEAWVWDGIALAMRGDQMYVNEPHASGGVPVLARTHAGADGAVTDERLLVSDYLGTTLAAINPADLNGAAVQGDATPAESLLLSTTGTGSAAADAQPSDLTRFTGKPYDEDMGAFVFPFRNYRPDLNSWTSADPAGFPDGPNQHFYAPVPTMGIDPWGLEQVPGVPMLHTAIFTEEPTLVSGKLFPQDTVPGSGQVINLYEATWEAEIRMSFQHPDNPNIYWTVQAQYTVTVSGALNVPFAAPSIVPLPIGIGPGLPNLGTVLAEIAANYIQGANWVGVDPAIIVLGWEQILGSKPNVAFFANRFPDDMIPTFSVE